MISIEEAKKRIKLHVSVGKETLLPTIDSLGYILSQDIYSPINLPSFNQSAMDGYAISFLDNTTRDYKIVAEIKAGDSHNIILNDGECARIFTGAMVPKGANAVVMQEKTTPNKTHIILKTKPLMGENIRLEGEQIKKQSLALRKGTLLTAAGIGFLTGLGLVEVYVYKKPGITLVLTGNELCKPSETLEKGKIYESNSLMLEAALKTSGYKEIKTLWVKDNLDSTIRALKKASNQSDVVLVSGGISVGDYDYVESALQSMNVNTVFYKVNQKPGKPFFFGKNDKSLFFALPGNPSASLICYYYYVLSALKQMSGFSEIDLEETETISKNNFSKKGSRAQFLKAQITQNQALLLEGQGSATLHTFALANALVYLAPNQIKIKKGDKLTAFLIPKT